MTNSKNNYLKVAIFILFLGCKKNDNNICTANSIIPTIEFKSINKKTFIDRFTAQKADSVSVLLNFKDEDFDLGMTGKERNETLKYSSPNYNFLVNALRKQNGIFKAASTIPASLSDVFLNVSVPNSTPQRPEPLVKTKTNTICSGEMIYDNIFYHDFSRKNDTIKFEIQIIDRALHKSNTIQTQEIIINKQN